ncbi:hypothetical protein [Pedobacter paludis]|uniref:Uncharacterized protein n=1 Tax=Pedobacter paludis TaxID=2203212 RepID=A0A317F183_9SPHI|nr:hypothetical protein [Pedobacter paludis]PWS31807.1 hypothetical protein DF947_08390 [Pedobacter paludis]
MSKHILTYLFLILALSASAQVTPVKPPIKKTVPKPPPPPKKPAIRFTPPKIKKDTYRYETPPPPPKYSGSMSIGAPPMVMESAEETKFRNERICTTCDTLKLEANVPHIIIYDVKWMSSPDTRSYSNQPTQSDLSKDYYALSGLNKREWDELHRNFPEEKYKYQYVFRNTLIETPNTKKQTLNLLDRQIRHTGFLFWSGNENDSTVHRTKMVQLTELVAEKIHDSKTSSYYRNFKKDSLIIENYQNTVNPSEKLKDNMNFFLEKEMFNEAVVPFQFTDLTGVSKIIIQSVQEADKRVTYVFNKNNQLIKIFEDRRDSTTITYKNGLPDVAVRQGQTFKFYYQNDLVIMKEKNYLSVFKLANKVFFDVERYKINKDDYSNMVLRNSDSKIVNEKCLESTGTESKKFEASICYNNTNWELPVKVIRKDLLYDKVIETNSTYSKNGLGNLVLESSNPYRSRKYEFTLQNNKFTSISSYSKRDGNEYGEPYVLNVTYGYFK